MVEFLKDLDSQREFLLNFFSRIPEKKTLELKKSVKEFLWESPEDFSRNTSLETSRKLNNLERIRVRSS